MKCNMCGKKVKDEGSRMFTHDVCENIKNSRFHAKQCQFCGEYIGDTYYKDTDMEVRSNQHCPDQKYVGYS